MLNSSFIPPSADLNSLSFTMRKPIMSDFVSAEPMRLRSIITFSLNSSHRECSRHSASFQTCLHTDRGDVLPKLLCNFPLFQPNTQNDPNSLSNKRLHLRSLDISAQRVSGSNCQCPNAFFIGSNYGVLQHGGHSRIHRPASIKDIDQLIDML